MPVIEILCEHESWGTVAGLEERIERAVSAALAASGVRLLETAEVAILLTDDAAVRALNAAWRGKDMATNVLSFPAAEGARLATSPMIGDIAVAFETCQREAQAEGKSLGDHAVHLAVHGALHLVGFDHEADEDAERMERLERQVLASLGIADPYAVREPAEART